MSKKSSKITITITPVKTSTWKLDFKGDTKPISAHRFTQLMGWENYVSKSELFLDFYGLKITTPNKRLDLGNVMESTILDYEYRDDTYIHYDFSKSNNGNIINPNGEEFNGIPDAIVPTRNCIGECKVTTVQDVDCKMNWYKQVQFYAYFWNKYLSETSGLKIDYVEVLRYYVPENLIDYQIANSNVLVLNNYHKYRFDLDETIEDDIKEAQLKKQELLNNGLIIRKNNSRILWQIAVGVINKKIKFKYDKNNEQCKELIDIINKIVKDERKKK